jgi:hypothetical protein
MLVSAKRFERGIIIKGNRMRKKRVGFQSSALDPDVAHPQPKPADIRPWCGFLPNFEVMSQSVSD